MNSEYPYPTIDEDGYEFDLIEQNEKEDYGFELPDFPTDDERNSVKSGDLVKLVFRYRDSIEKNGHTITCERMWVEMKEHKGSHLVGRLDSSPMYTKLLLEDTLVQFHPKHIIAFWKE